MMMQFCIFLKYLLQLLLGRVNISFWQGPFYPNASTKFGADGALHTECGAKGCLFDIFDDPTEHNEISSQYPDVST